MKFFVLVYLMSCSAACAAGFSFSFGSAPNGEHPYPNEPQYQYPRTDGKEMKCPKGQAPYQGKCRMVRRLPGAN